MPKIVVNPESLKKSTILIGNCIDKLSDFLPETKTIFIIDNNVLRLYSNIFDKYAHINIEANEKNKTLQTIAHICEQLIDMQADRKTFIVGVGGGITCDMAGFVSSIFMRGVRFGFVSTSLLSQVDASVGGKNGVNFERYKNMIGCFNQPEFVLCDTPMLKTLPPREISCGVAEIIKTAIIADSEMFLYIEKHTNEILNIDENILEHLIEKSVKHKADIVNRDEHENGERRKLNLGHTLAHAIEKNSDIPHGYAVGIGLVFASKVAQKLGMIKETEVNRIINLLQSLNIPVSTEIDRAKLAESIGKDKKKDGDTIHFILPQKIGSVEEKILKTNEIKKLIYDLC